MIGEKTSERKAKLIRRAEEESGSRAKNVTSLNSFWKEFSIHSKVKIVHMICTDQRGLLLGIAEDGKLLVLLSLKFVKVKQQIIHFQY